MGLGGKLPISSAPPRQKYPFRRCCGQRYDSFILLPKSAAFGIRHTVEHFPSFLSKSAMTSRNRECPPVLETRYLPSITISNSVLTMCLTDARFRSGSQMNFPVPRGAGWSA